MKRGEIWYAALASGDRPVLVLTRDPVADRVGWVVVAQLTQTRRGLASEFLLTPETDGVLKPCVVSFDNINTIARDRFRRRITTLTDTRMRQACRHLLSATGC